MEDKERIEATDEDVEGHRRAKKLPMAADETSDEDVEAHRRAKKLPMAADEPSEDDDVEAHALRNRPQSL